MRWLAFVPLGILLTLIGVVLAEPGETSWWQRALAIVAFLTSLPLSGALFEDMSTWVEEKREESA